MFGDRRSIGARSVVAAALLAGASFAGNVHAAEPAMTSGAKTHTAMNATHISGTFTGIKANTGTVCHETISGKQVLTLSDEFVVPDTPAPHWQIVDSSGNVYLLQRLKITGDKYNKTITLPSYIKDVASVQIWCSFAEVVLGEAKFAMPVR